MLGSDDVRSEHKGGRLLLEAMNQLPAELRRKTTCLVMGRSGKEFVNGLDMKCVAMGYTASDQFKAAAYSAADVFLHPTRADTFSLVCQESIACGTPVVAFNVGGVSELVRPNETGILAGKGDTTAFARATEELLTNEDRRRVLGEGGRKLAMKEFRLETQVERVAGIYREAVARE